MSTDRVQGQEGARPGVPARDPEAGPGRARGHALVPAQEHAQGHFLVPVKAHARGQALVPAKEPGQGHALVPAKEQAEDPPDRGHSAGMVVERTSANTVNGEAEAGRHRNAVHGLSVAVRPGRAVLGLPADEEAEDAVVVGDAKLTSNWQQY